MVSVFASRRPPRRLYGFAGVLAMLLVGACDRRAADTTIASTSRPVPATPDSAPFAASRWDMAAGPFLVLPTVDGGMTAGSLLRPDATDQTVSDTSGLAALLGDGRIDLFTRGGRLGAARMTVHPGQSEPGCVAWPVARLALDPATPRLPWTVAFAAGRTTPIALDSIEGLAPRDSGRLAVQLTRLASALRDDTVPTFRGLPFVVLHAWRSRGADPGFVVATLVRRVNQEDSPREERLVMVVDQPSADPATWTVSWTERASGLEETLVVAEPLLAFRAGTSPDTHLLFGRDDGVTLSAAVLVRRAGQWTVLWESAIAGCD